MGAKFAGRYYDGVGCGILLYGASDNGMIPYIDKSSILPMPLYNPVIMEEEKVFEMTAAGAYVDPLTILDMSTVTVMSDEAFE